MRALRPDERKALLRDLATIPRDEKRQERKREVMARHSVVATRFGLMHRY